MLNTTVRNCPNGLPFALKINDVTPISDAANVRYFSLSKMKNETAISATDKHHSIISALVKYPINSIYRLSYYTVCICFSQQKADRKDILFFGRFKLFKIRSFLQNQFTVVLLL